MPILFAVVSRGTTVLAKYASCAGNFTEVTEQILSKIGPEDSKLTYSHGSYLFHYISEDRIIYLCISDDDFERSKAFLFLNEVKRRFQTQYGVRAQTALPYSMNSEFSRVLASQMRYVTDKMEPDKVEKVQGQVDELKGIMVKNIDNIADRGEKLELLVDKTEELNANAVSFKKSSRGLARDNTDCIAITSLTGPGGSQWFDEDRLCVYLRIVISINIIIIHFVPIQSQFDGIVYSAATFHP
uniref:Vesicle-associated membrane protein 7 n=1 Tax=Magallana gigas TaxID=29159 RepID=K1RNJ1_MAGGI